MRLPPRYQLWLFLPDTFFSPDESVRFLDSPPANCA